MPYAEMAERLLALRTPGEIAIAPDGLTVAFSVHPAAAQRGSHLPSEIWLLEQARREPGLGTIVKLASCLGTSPEALCDGISWRSDPGRFEIKPPRPGND